MSRSSVRYKPVPQPCNGLDDIDDESVGEDTQPTELPPQAPNPSTEGLPSVRSLVGRLLPKRNFSSGDTSLPIYAPTTPMSSDGVFSNIPAKPSSSRDCNKDDEELGEDEWIFMTPEQRKKLAPPKYSRVKRDRAPAYTTEYTPPDLPPDPNPRKRKRASILNPRINSLPAGSSAGFIATVFLCTLLPFFGFLLVYITNLGRWKSHASRLGAWTGMGLGLFHMGAMFIYIPALLPSVSALSSAPWIAFLLWMAFVGLPLGWRLSIHTAREFMWVQAQERVLRANLGLAPASNSTIANEDEEDVESSYRYIQGTDIRVRDLRKILARARDARLARSLRAAGF